MLNKLELWVVVMVSDSPTNTLIDHPLLHLPEHSFSLSELHSVLSPTPVWNELSLVLGELTFQETNSNYRIKESPTPNSLRQQNSSWLMGLER